jgi:2'-5' RNA ligase
VSLLLFMIRVPADMARDIINLMDLLKRGYGLENWAYEGDRLHIILFELGDHVDLPLEIVALANRAAGSIRTSPFGVEFDRIDSWSDALVLLGKDEPTPLKTFRHELGAALKRVGLGRKAGFTPHVTLMRGRTAVEQQAVKTFRWTVNEFVLVNSYQGKYVELARWPLRG